MDMTPREQFAQTLANLVSSAVKTAVEYDDGDHIIRPAVDLLKATFDDSGRRAYDLTPWFGNDVAVQIALCERGALDPLLVTNEVMLSDILAAHAGYADDEAAFWVAVDAAVASAKKKVDR